MKRDERSLKWAKVNGYKYVECDDEGNIKGYGFSRQTLEYHNLSEYNVMTIRQYEKATKEAFKAGANWQYEQFEKERLKHCDELTAEQAQMESDFVVQHLEKYNRTPTFIDAIEYGRKLMIDKAIEWLENNQSQEVSVISGGYVHINFDNAIEEFKKAMED